MRRLRSFIAVWLIGVLVFAQGVTAAHACAIASGGAVFPATATPTAARALRASPIPGAAPASTHRAAMPADRARHAHQDVPPPANDCVAHCVSAQQANATAVEVSAPPPPCVPLVVAAAPAGAQRYDVRPALPPSPAAAPPPRLRFARFLV